MRHIYWASTILAAAMALPMAPPMRAQVDGQATAQGGGAGAGQGRGQGRRGGFGGGQMVEGTVTAVAPDKVTIKTDAGETYDVVTTANTRIMKDRQPIALTDVKVGDGVGAMGVVDASAKSVHAMFLTDIDAATMQKARENMGKTYITGKITAIDADNLALTIGRTDGVSQTIKVDEGTTFERGTRGVAAEVAEAGGAGMMGGGRRGGGGMAEAPAPEEITLADVKVGDTVMAVGELKNGVFVPTKMGVAEPGAGRRRGAGAEGVPMAPPQ